MSWTSLAHTMARPLPVTTRLPDDLVDARARRITSTNTAIAVSDGIASGAGLGSARAGIAWRWAPPAENVSAHRGREMRGSMTENMPVSIPAGVLQAMRAAAYASGRSESAVWAEAAREWLRQRQHDDGPPSPPAAALAVPRRSRSWHSIDAVLADLRQPRHVPVSGEPAA